jgi:hypothetical protein
VRIVRVNGIEVIAVTDTYELYNPGSRVYQEMNESSFQMAIIGKDGKRQVHLMRTPILRK